MGGNEIIGHVHLRLRYNCISDVEIKKLLDEKHLHGCKTNTAMIKKALLFYIRSNGAEATDITSKHVYDSLFK